MSDLSAFAHTRQWWPAELMDEMMPAGRPAPQDWLEPDENGVTLIHVDDDERNTVIEKIDPGATVQFLWHENRGEIEIAVMPDGTWTIADQRDDRTIDMFDQAAGLATTTPSSDLPPLARIAASNWFAWDEDYETMMDTMDGFAREWAAMTAPPPEGAALTVRLGFWSDGVPFRVSPDGKTLERVEVTDA